MVKNGSFGQSDAVSEFGVAAGGAASGAARVMDLLSQIKSTSAAKLIKTLVKIKEIAGINKTTEIVDLAASSITEVETNLNDAYAIMDALQFQDITSQQMNHAASILEEIEIRLDKILSVVGHIPEPKKEKLPKIKKERAFDPNADMNSKQTEQSDIDSLFAAKSEK